MQQTGTMRRWRLALSAFLLAVGLVRGGSHSADSASGRADFRDYTLTVVSAHPTPTPVVGVHTYAWGATVECSLADGSATHEPTGWTGTGSVPATGAELTTGGLVLDEVAGSTASSITWTWRPTTYALVVVGGSGSGDYTQGAVVPVEAAAPAPGRTFAGWTVNPVQYEGNLAAAALASTTFTMPDQPVTLTATYGYTDPMWAVPLTVAGAVPATLTIGMHPAATDGWDPGLDVDYPLPGPGQACLAADDLALSYSTDYRAPGATAEFLLLASATENEAITVSWTAPALPEGKYLTAYEVILEGIAPSRAAAARTLVGNTARNMALTSSLEIPAGETRCYVIRYGDELVFDLAFAAGWNLISLPIEPLVPAVDAVLDDGPARGDSKLRDGLRGTISSRSAWSWQGQGYVAAAELHACVGYWVHAATPAVLLVKGMPVVQNGLVLVQGWNLCGAAEVRAVPADARIRGAVWLWNAPLMRYQSVTGLLPGWGYWINAGEGATIPFPER